ncbi:14344_t:CDS:2 [Funneliformis caledonium]|uniref:14344_t:CDS:1 n=1 Tax=Funneliformis caledonium TaxID=1117310 RepID=A0A9N9EZE8_9GLOM|nr:14344_t:CDS:2 [Funneliformis caledonium]
MTSEGVRESVARNLCYTRLNNIYFNNDENNVDSCNNGDNNTSSDNCSNNDSSYDSNNSKVISGKSNLYV